jgi:hypothetical protein
MTLSPVSGTYSWAERAEMAAASSAGDLRSAGPMWGVLGQMQDTIRAMDRREAEGARAISILEMIAGGDKAALSKDLQEKQVLTAAQETNQRLKHIEELLGQPQRAVIPLENNRQLEALITDRVSADLIGGR